MTAENQPLLDDWARIVALEGFDHEYANAIRAWLDDASGPFGGAWLDLFDRDLTWNAGDLRPEAASVYRSLARGLAVATGRRAAWILADLDSCAAMLGPCLTSGRDEQRVRARAVLAALIRAVPAAMAGVEGKDDRARAWAASFLAQLHRHHAVDGLATALTLRFAVEDDAAVRYVLALALAALGVNKASVVDVLVLGVNTDDGLLANSCALGLADIDGACDDPTTLAMLEKAAIAGAADPSPRPMVIGGYHPAVRLFDEIELRGGVNALLALLARLPSVDEDRRLAERLLVRAYGAPAESRGLESRAEHVEEFREVKTTIARRPGELTDDQRRLARAILEDDLFWAGPTNRLTRFGLPGDRKHLQHLLEGPV